MAVAVAVACTVASLAALSFAWWRLRRKAACIFLLKGTGQAPELALPAEIKWHGFLSHTWASGYVASNPPDAYACACMHACTCICIYTATLGSDEMVRVSAPPPSSPLLSSPALALLPCHPPPLRSALRQDQVKVIKTALTALLPRVRLFLGTPCAVAPNARTMTARR